MAVAALSEILLNREELPYGPAWLDRLQELLERSKTRAWAFYLVLWLAPILVVNASMWVDRAQPFPHLSLFHVTLWGTGVIALALTHFLNVSAETSLAAFRPALDVSDRELALLRYRLTTLPAGKAALVAGFGVVIAVAELATLPPDAVDGLGLFSSPTATLVEAAMYVFGWIFFSTLVYHTIHQLRVVGYIHAQCTRVNLFRLGPIYSFSWLTARTALGIALLPYLYFAASTAISPSSFQPQYLYVVSLNLMVAFALFVWPLLGIHRVLQREKALRLRESAIRLENAVQELHDRADARDYGVMDGLNKLISSLTTEQAVLERISTWPWRPETPRLLASALLLPLVVYLAQRALAGALGY